MTTQQNDNPHPLPHESGENTPNGGGITLDVHGRVRDSVRDVHDRVRDSVRDDLRRCSVLRSKKK
jgi:hypothetical protein